MPDSRARRLAPAALLVGCLIGPAVAPAQEPVRLSAGEWSAHGGVGFTADPDTALLTTGIEYGVTDFMAVGPLLQLGLDDDDTIVAPTLNFRFGIDLSDVGNEYARRIEPFVQVGAGFAYIEKERRPGDDDDVGFLANGGFGVQYWATDGIAIGSSVLFNGMPDDVEGEEFFFSWQALTVRFRF